MSLIIFPVTLTQVFASQMEAALFPTLSESTPVYTSIKFVTINYEPGSELSQIFNGVAEVYTININSTTDGMDDVLKSINNVILRERNSPIQIQDGDIAYTAQIRGDEDSASLSYKLKFYPTITNFILPSNGTADVIDLDWRSFKVNEPLVINTPEYQNFDINSPLGIIEQEFPDAAQKLSTSEELTAVLKSPLLDYEELGMPMDRWHFLFDPTGSQATAAGVFEEVGGVNVVSIFSLGESSFREGTHSVTEQSANDQIEGSDVSIKSTIPPPSGQIQIGGFAKVQQVGNAEVAFVTPDAPQGTVTSTGGFPIQVLLVLGGMMGAVAVLVLLKARK